MASRKIQSFEDLDVYQKSLQLHFEVHELTMTFPKFELYELGSQLRRASNSITANIAESWNNKHINMYLEGINRALGELRETQHHVHVCFKKSYISEMVYESLKERYNECGKMLKGLERSLVEHHAKATELLR